VDEGDPFVDADDNGAYDPAPASGLSEIRFCGLTADCSTYHGPNGTWDADTVIWKPTWVVFHGRWTRFPVSRTVSFLSVQSFHEDLRHDPHRNDCADTRTRRPIHPQSKISASVYVYDRWLNLPAAGHHTSVGGPTSAKLTATTFGFGTLLESWGAMESFGFDFDWVRVSAANNTLACSAATSPCIEKLVFAASWLPGSVRILITNTTTKPLASDPIRGATKLPNTSFSMQGLVAAEHASVLFAADTLTQSKSNPRTPMAPQLSSRVPKPNVVAVSLAEVGRRRWWWCPRQAG